jgi:hypothetical protein
VCNAHNPLHNVNFIFKNEDLVYLKKDTTSSKIIERRAETSAAGVAAGTAGK